MLTQKDIIDFLRALYLGDCSDPYRAAVNAAYAKNTARTVHGMGKVSQTNKKAFRDALVEIIRKAVQNLKSRYSPVPNPQSQANFDKWHKDLCNQIQAACGRFGIVPPLTIGQIQKIINMSLKYLYVLGEFDDVEGIEQYFHMPIDDEMIKAVKKQLGISPNDIKPNISIKPWSKLNDYDAYKKYQEAIRAELAKRGTTPFDWEFGQWTKAKQKP